jgi:hypothetical protein
MGSFETHEARRSEARMRVRSARLGAFAVALSASLSACGGSDTAGNTCDPSANPGCDDASVLDGSLPDGSTILPDGAVVLPDGAVVLPDGAIEDTELSLDAGDDATTDSSFGDAGDTAGDGSSDGATPDAVADSADGTTPDATGDAATETGDGAICKPYGQLCVSGAECCSGSCDSGNHCTSTIGACKALLQPCSSATECCSLSCVGGACAASACVSDGKTCTSNASCCSGTCTGGTCAALNTSCKTAGNACTGNADCCSTLCTAGRCVLAASYCTQLGDVCSRGTDCCTGICNVAAGKSLGTCAPNTTGSTNCTGAVDGTVCTGDCGQCCSRLCAPYGPTGVKICQPANGCHVNGDLCRSDYDCCGAAGSGEPGAGNGGCVFMTGQTIGICRNPTGCNPEGNVCHYKADTVYACTVSSSRNDCCSAPGNSGVCKLDALGIPRCFGGGACSPAGASCAYSGDCCGGLPCVPNPSGTSPPFVCGATTCQKAGAGCTIDGDCCAGLLCNKPPGSASGTCGGYVPPGDAGTDTGTDGGASDSSTGDSSTGDAGTSDSGTTPDSSTSDTSTTTDSGTVDTACAFYGQACSTSGDCCNGVTCRTASGSLCSGGTAGCTCHDFIQ